MTETAATHARADGVVAVFAALVAALAGARTLAYDWAIIDDGVLVVRRPTVVDPLSQSLGDLVLTPGMGHSMPVTNASLAFDHALWGLDAAGWHASNVVWLALALALAGVAARRWVRTTPWVVCAALALIGFHPALAEPVAWVSSRKDLVMAAMLSGAIACTAPGRPASQELTARAALLSFAFAFLALGAKSTAVAFGPPLLLLWWMRRAPAVWLWRGGVSWAIAGAAAVAAASRQQAELLRREPVWSELLAGWVASYEHHVLRLLTIPGASAYEAPSVLVASMVGAVLLAVGVGAFAGSAVSLQRAEHRDRALGAWAVVAAACVLAPVVFGASTLLTALADRYVLPCLLPVGVVAVTWALDRLRLPRHPGLAVAIALGAALLLRPAQAARMDAWASPVSFYRAAAFTHELDAATTLGEAWSCYWRGGVFIASVDHRRQPFFESARDRDVRLMLAYQFWDACTEPGDATAECASSPDPLACALRRTTRRDRDRALRMWRAGRDY